MTSIRIFVGILAVAMLAVRGAAAPVDPPPKPLFNVRTSVPGLDYRNVSGGDEQGPILEQNGQGIALLDFDSDGWLDIFVTNGGTLERWRAGHHPGARLFRNSSGWRFEDVTVRAGVGVAAWSNGAAAADYDDDGDMDLYVTNWGPNVLYRNDGDGSFTDVTVAKAVGDPRWSSSATFADFDGDGRLDLYVSNYVAFDPDQVPQYEEDGSPCSYRSVATGCAPWRYKGERDTLYLQDRAGKFRDASKEWGLEATAGFRGMGVAPGDFDADGDVDLYVGCDVMPNLYLENLDSKRFRSAGERLGGAVNAEGQHESGMGVAAADLFNRGWLDLLTTNFAGQKNTYYRNEGGRLQDASGEVGIDRHRSELGWGILVEDFDQDGRRDVFITNGQIYPQVARLEDPEDRYAQSPRFYRGTSEAKLREVEPQRAFTLPDAWSLRAAAAGDLDNDGDVDVIAIQHRGPLVVFENTSDRPATIVELRTRSGGLSPHGTQITIGSWHHFHWPSQGYQSSHDSRVFIPRAVSGDVVVTWPDGSRERIPRPQIEERVTWQQTIAGAPTDGKEDAQVTHP